MAKFTALLLLLVPLLVGFTTPRVYTHASTGTGVLGDGTVLGDLNLATGDITLDAGDLTLTLGDIFVPGGDIKLNNGVMIYFDWDGTQNDYITGLVDGQIRTYMGGSNKLIYTTGEMQFKGGFDLNMDGEYAYDSTRSLQLGGTCTTTQSLVTGDTCISGSMEVLGSFYLAPYTYELDVAAGSAVLGPTAPAWDVQGSIGGLGFDADAESVYHHVEVPNCWDGASDLVVEAYWTNESGDAVADTETVKWDFEYRSIVWGTEGASNGTAVTATATYTQVGAGADGDTHKTTLTIDYDHANQPITAGDIITGRFDRDVTADTYSGKGIVGGWHFELNADQVCDH